MAANGKTQKHCIEKIRTNGGAANRNMFDPRWEDQAVSRLVARGGLKHVYVLSSECAAEYSVAATPFEGKMVAAGVLASLSDAERAALAAAMKKSPRGTSFYILPA